MKLVTFFSLIFTILLTALVAHSEASNNINIYRIVTENAPPFNYKENGQTKGIVSDLVAQSLQDMGSTINSKQFIFQNWSDSYNQSMTQENTMLFTIVLNDERQNLFKWAGPIIETKIVVIALKDNNSKITSPLDLNNYITGVIKKDIGESTLSVNKVNPKNVKGFNDFDVLFDRFNKKEINFLCYEVNYLKWYIKQSGKDFESNYKIVYEFDPSYAYVAFQKETPDEVVISFQNSLLKMVSQNLDVLVKKYIY